VDFLSVVLADFSAQTRSPQLILVPWWKLWGRWGRGPRVQLEEMGLCYTPHYVFLSSATGSGCLPKQVALGQDTAAY
jgi:hypothetical protein